MADDINGVNLCPSEEEESTDIVTLCDENDEEDTGTVTLCDENEEEEQQEIPPDRCAGTIDISGTETPTVGSTYAVENGQPPYTWGISAGAISEAGTITSLSGACGYGTISVTDSCGRSASKQVRFPSGQWVLTNTQIFDPPGDNPWPGCGGSKTVTEIAGSSKTETVWKHAWDCLNDYCAQCSECVHATFEGDPATYCKVKTLTYQWQCP